MNTVALWKHLLTSSASLFLLISCGPPESEHPLGDPKTAKSDPSLEGVWKGQMVDGNVVYLHICAVSNSEMDLVLVVSGKSKKDGVATIGFRFFPVEINGKHYLNLREKTPVSFLQRYNEDKVSKSYLFAKYELSPDGQLSLWSMSASSVAQTTENGDLRGRVQRGKVRLTEDPKNEGLDVIARVELTDETPKLAQFVQTANHDTLFDLFCRAKKLP
jgi:hypothetical protein